MIKPVWNFLYKQGIVVRYIFSGVCSAATNLILLFFLKKYVGLFYLTASTLGFIGAFLVSFLLQKYLTFQDKDNSRIYAQAPVYLVIVILSALANAGLMKLFVESFHIWYLLSQIFTIAILAVANFFAYRFFVFRKSNVI
jgi:putative flippase GtrA